MAELVYDENGRLLFTKEMKEEYTILFPTMLPVHFGLMARILETEGFHVEMLTTNHRGIVDEGLKYVHNDTCYPALLVIGQLIDAVKSGKYDMHKVALLITQTGGGCRASNYIHLLRKALEKAGLSYIPVISVNLSGLEPNPGFKLGAQHPAQGGVRHDVRRHHRTDRQPGPPLRGQPGPDRRDHRGRGDSASGGHEPGQGPLLQEHGGQL